MVATGGSWKDLRNGAVLQMLEAATLGLPFEIWKTRMARFRTETTLQAMRGVYQRGGLGAFWAGFMPKMTEAATKGAVFMWSKEMIIAVCASMGMSPTMSALIGGGLGGVAQVSVIAPTTMLVTGAVTGDRSVGTMQRMANIYKSQGIKGFYPGGLPIALRQATNWASREGFTVKTRELFRKWFHNNDQKARLSAIEEVACAAIGGTLSCWNHPFEVARVEMQSRADQGHARLSMFGVFKTVMKEEGVAGLFRGVPPRIALSVWQTLFMVTGGHIIKERFM